MSLGLSHACNWSFQEGWGQRARQLTSIFWKRTKPGGTGGGPRWAVCEGTAAPARGSRVGTAGWWSTATGSVVLAAADGEYYTPERCAQEQRGFVLNAALFC